MALERLRIAADEHFWCSAARAVTDFAAAHGAPPRQFQAVTWLVPGGSAAELARAALRAELGGAAFIPPRIVPLATWLGVPMQAGTAARAELFAALRTNDWIGTAFGSEGAALWALARDVAALCDELTLAAADSVESFDGRLRAGLARHFRRHAARALQAQSQLVLHVWRARRSADDGAARALKQLAARAARIRQPLVYTAAGLSNADHDGCEPWERAFLAHAAGLAPVMLLVPDVGAALAGRPLLAAAWPELAGADADLAIAARADALQATSATLAAPVSIVATATLEEEATVVARQVLDWRRGGVERIALVTLDRLTARRVRALLERAQVRVRDETGWKLSTTSAAAAVMRWYDLVTDDVYWRDLLDWLKSNFTLAGRPGKKQEVDRIERAIRANGALQGAATMRRALTDLPPDDARDANAGALEVLTLVESEARATRRAPPTLPAHAQALRRAMDALGMRAALAADPVGRTVLLDLDALEGELSGVAGRASLADFRALLAARFEETAFVDRDIDSPVVMVSLAAAALRDFEAAVLIGADAQHLPAPPSEVLFMSNAVRAELGLATADSVMREQSAQLAVLLASTARVVATWRTRRADEPNPLSPLLDRLQLVAQRALHDDLMRAPLLDGVAVEARPTLRPAPAGAQLLPARLSASQAQSLVDCPYQFYARSLLGLRAVEDVIEVPDKREFGVALHDVLRRFHQAWGGADFSALPTTELAASLREHARAVFAPQVERAPGLLAFERRFAGLVAGYIDWLQQHAAAGWRWLRGEESCHRTVALSGGRDVELAGRVDRIDACADGQLILLDYKARSVDVLRRGLKEPGEDIQLPFYGLLLPRRPQSAEYVSFDRARADVPGVQAVAPATRFDALTEAVGARLASDLQRIADGAPLPAIGAESVCEHCEMRGLCRRDFWRTDGEGAAGPADA